MTEFRNLASKSEGDIPDYTHLRVNDLHRYGCFGAYKPRARVPILNIFKILGLVVDSKFFTYTAQNVLRRRSHDFLVVLDIEDGAMSGTVFATWHHIGRNVLCHTQRRDAQ